MGSTVRTLLIESTPLLLLSSSSTPFSIMKTSAPIYNINEGLKSDLELKSISTEQNICEMRGHSRLEIDEANRLCQCTTCGMYVDPFDWLLHWAKSEERERLAIGYLKNMEKDLNKSIYEKKEELKRLKNQVRYWRKQKNSS